MASTKARTMGAALALVLTLFLLMLVLVGFFLLQSQRDAVEQGKEKAELAARSVASHAQWIVEATQQTLRRIDDSLGREPVITSGTAEALSAALATLPANAFAAVFDANGRRLLPVSSADNVFDIEGEQIVADLRRGESFAVWARPLRNGEVDRTALIVARRLERRGVFMGIAAIALPSELMSDFWSTLGLGAGSTVSIVRTDGWVVARFPSLAEPLNLASYELFTKHLPEAPSGSYQAQRSPADGMSRLVGYSRVAGAPLVAIASISTQTALTSHNGRIRRLLYVILPALLGLAALAGWVMYLLRKEVQRQMELEAALDQNRLLFREIHHRVKNNLQTIGSLIRLQAMPAEVKRNLNARIAAMASVHEQIYSSDRFGDVRMDSYLRDIAEGVRSGYDEPVDIDYEMEPITLDPDRAMALGLILTELVSNSLKHGFANRTSGRLKVRLARDPEGMVHFHVNDDGVGFDPALKSEGLGLRLISGLAGQLNAQYELKGSDGLAFDLRFPDTGHAATA